MRPGHDRPLDLRRSAVPLALVAAVTIVADLVVKVLAVDDPHRFGPGIQYNPDMPPIAVRVLVCVVTLGVLAALSAFAARRGVGAIPIVWVAGGLLVGGVVAQGISGVVWELGVPDMFHRGDRVWNLADWAIGLGMLLFLLASVGYTLRAFVRARR